MSQEKRPFCSRLPRWLLEAFVLFAIILALRAWHAPKMTGEILPRLAGQTLTGQEVDTAALAGQGFIVHIWGSWCPVCRMELSGMARLARDVPVVSIAWRSGDDAAVRAFLAGEGVKLPVINDPDGRLVAGFGVKGVPLHLVVDGAGRIRFIETGYTTSWGLKARLWWAKRVSAR
ncbi:MAG: protein disulfide oxidoreductase [Gammaproteobacteria bacterium]|nr:protein disulfide oxidoreductase [Gammaproteobacteria bacterium]